MSDQSLVFCHSGKYYTLQCYFYFNGYCIYFLDFNEGINETFSTCEVGGGGVISIFFVIGSV